MDKVNKTNIILRESNFLTQEDYKKALNAVVKALSKYSFKDIMREYYDYYYAYDYISYPKWLNYEEEAENAVIEAIGYYPEKGMCLAVVRLQIT